MACEKEKLVEKRGTGMSDGDSRLSIRLGVICIKIGHEATELREQPHLTCAKLVLIRIAVQPVLIDFEFKTAVVNCNFRVACLELLASLVNQGLVNVE